VKKFEDKKTLKYCRAVETFQQQMDEQIELEDAIETLRTANTEVAINGHSDWREAIIGAAHQYELNQVAGALIVVHQEYTFRVENSINFPQSLIDKKREEYAFQLCEVAKQQILEGRRLAGESEDMKF
jgi:hypothetical protein